MKSKLIKLYKDENGSATSTISGLVILMYVILIMFVLIDFYYISNIYRYVKAQQDLANRAVYAEIDLNKLAHRELYLDDNLAKSKFNEYLRKNLELNAANKPGRDIKMVGEVKIKQFIVYNTDDVPAVTPNGVSIDLLTVYSEIEIELIPFLYGRYGSVKVNPKITTQLPDKLVKLFHPIATP